MPSPPNDMFQNVAVELQQCRSELYFLLDQTVLNQVDVSNIIATDDIQRHICIMYIEEPQARFKRNIAPVNDLDLLLTIHLSVVCACHLLVYFHQQTGVVKPNDEWLIGAEEDWLRLPFVNQVVSHNLTAVLFWFLNQFNQGGRLGKIVKLWSAAEDIRWVVLVLIGSAVKECHILLSNQQNVLLADYDVTIHHEWQPALVLDLISYEVIYYYWRVIVLEQQVATG